MNKTPTYKVNTVSEYKYLLKYLKIFDYNIDNCDNDLNNDNVVVLNLSGILGCASNISKDESDYYGRYLCGNILTFLDKAAKLKNKNFDFDFLGLYKIICKNQKEADLIIELLRKKSIKYKDYVIENGEFYIILNDNENISLNYNTIYEYYFNVFKIDLNIIKNSFSEDYLEEDYLLLLI